jgi:hypothetical protein
MSVKQINLLRIKLYIFSTCSYTLTSSAYLNVDPDTGSVTVNADFNYNRQPQVFATVRADDTAIPPHFDYAQIVINVSDINDMRPVLFMVRIYVYHFIRAVTASLTVI